MIEKSNKYLIDSNIIIYHLNGENKATEFLKSNIDFSSISRLTFAEVLSFDLSEDETNSIITFLRQFEILDTTDAIAMKALENRQVKKIKLVDNIIASTAQVNELTLVTRNTKDFNNIDLQILDIFEI